MQCKCIRSALLVQLWRRRASFCFVLCLLKHLIFTEPKERIHQPGFICSGWDRSLLLLLAPCSCLNEFMTNKRAFLLWRDYTSRLARFPRGCENLSHVPGVFLSLPSPTNSEVQRFAFRASGIQTSHLALKLPCSPSAQKLLIFDSWGNRWYVGRSGSSLSETLIYPLALEKCVLRAISPAASQTSPAAMPCSCAPHL